MREVTFQQLSNAVRELCIQANTILPQDLRVAICKAIETEQSGVGRAILGDLKENYEFAQAKGLPICQDTGMAVVFVDWGQDCHLTGGNLEDAVNDGWPGVMWTGTCACRWWPTPCAGATPTTIPPPSSICAWFPGTG